MMTSFYSRLLIGPHSKGKGNDEPIDVFYRGEENVLRVSGDQNDLKLGAVHNNINELQT